MLGVMGSYWDIEFRRGRWLILFFVKVIRVFGGEWAVGE